MHWKERISMENNMSSLLVGTVVKKALRSIKEDPERCVRNLVDMALQFSAGRFQKRFFTAAQTMLQNENSGYYNLIRHSVVNADTDHLYTFGMNLGYNGCTVGADRIRKNEAKLGCRIPWTIILQLDPKQYASHVHEYHTLIRDGEALGIYTWMIFAQQQPETVLSLAAAHPDSAFVLFCEPEDVSSAFLDHATEIQNLMITVRYDEETSDIICASLRDMGLLYSVWYQYDSPDAEQIVSGDLFCSAQQLHPIFTTLVPNPECTDEVQQRVYQTVQEARSDQRYCTIPLELVQDNCLIDSIISDDVCSVYFDKDGNLYNGNGKLCRFHQNLFKRALADILLSAYPSDSESVN